MAGREGDGAVVHSSHSFVVFRHSSDERNPTDVIGRSVPVKCKWAARQDRNRDGQHPGSALSKNRQQRHRKEFLMNQGIRTVIYPVKDIAQAKALYSKLLGVEPYADEAYYVGFRVGDQEIGLDPNGHSQGMTGPVGYWDVDYIEESLKLLLDAGAEAQQAIRDVGGGKLIASVKDARGNITG